MGMHWEIRTGDFGETEEEIRVKSGQERYNIQTTTKFAMDLVEPGVISADGLTIWVKNVLGVGVMQWCSEEEVEVFEASKDPVEAPSHPYQENPGHLGKFLWITGAPGLGKSTVSQLLAREHGFVFYEGDCFMFSRSPFIPADVAEPSMAQFLQKPLRGKALEERQKILAKVFVESDKFLKGEDYDEEIMFAYLENQVNDLKTQRERIGGDWAVASVVHTRRWRDFARKKFGPDLQFVVLDMPLEQQLERVKGRQGDDPETIAMFKALYLKFEPASESEENTVGVRVTVDMTPHDVAQAILREVNKK